MSSVTRLGRRIRMGWNGSPPHVTNRLWIHGGEASHAVTGTEYGVFVLHPPNVRTDQESTRRVEEVSTG